MDDVMDLSESSQHPHSFKGDGYIMLFKSSKIPFSPPALRYILSKHLLILSIPKTLEGARLRQTSEGTEHRWTL